MHFNTANVNTTATQSSYKCGIKIKRIGEEMRAVITLKYLAEKEKLRTKTNLCFRRDEGKVMEKFVAEGTNLITFKYSNKRIKKRHKFFMFIYVRKRNKTEMIGKNETEIKSKRQNQMSHSNLREKEEKHYNKISSDRG